MSENVVRGLQQVQCQKSRIKESLRFRNGKIKKWQVI